MFRRAEQGSSDSESVRLSGGHSQGALHDKEVVTAEVG
jgi:hypothetical protein